ncbi:hypothetical protein TeGR_g2212 [Tetraparma gracilis]|uniref:F-box domain-containing protein n=1 Tax=Tetraparma gracilis TaxID=2962635 RepID=A0ABQ6MHR9_9STRA|nr:hypothetical protein TeGR_g2212 [Tetraparma gracilis]
MSRAPTSLAALPSDVLRSVMYLLPPRCFASLSSCCRSLRAVADGRTVSNVVATTLPVFGEALRRNPALSPRAFYESFRDTSKPPPFELADVLFSVRFGGAGEWFAARATENIAGNVRLTSPDMVSDGVYVDRLEVKMTSISDGTSCLVYSAGLCDYRFEGEEALEDIVAVGGVVQVPYADCWVKQLSFSSDEWGSHPQIQCNVETSVTMEDGYAYTEVMWVSMTAMESSQHDSDPMSFKGLVAILGGFNRGECWPVRFG